MCGIVGIVSKNSMGFFGDIPTIFEEMLYADGLRGMDSTGCFQINKKNQVDAIKQAVDPGIFFRTNAWKAFKNDINKKAIMVVGHNRKATVGEVVSKNAHPFVKSEIVLVHNGFIGNWKYLDDKAEVDSQAIVTTLLKESDPLKAIDKLYGAFAIVWYNHKTKKLYLTRNSDRPLYIVDGKDNIFFASEPEMMKWIFARNKYSATPDATEIVPGTLVEINLNPFKMEVKELPKRTIGSPVPWREEKLEGDQACGWPQSFLDKEPDAEFPLEDLTQTRTGDLVKDMDTKVKAIQRVYPQGHMVLFEPKTFVNKGSKPNDYVQVLGPAWVPGAEPIEAIWNIEDVKDKEIYLDFGAPLLGVVSCIWRRGDQLRLLLEKVTLPRETFTDFVGTQMSAQEWRLICARELCSKCGLNPKGSAPEFTCLNRIEGTYNVVCDKCTAHSYAHQPTQEGPPDGKAAQT